ncbi:MAG: hypothetical protein EKK55_06980 [Rhodocyclaceae bacterium]|nr:MAG: hypothetical protein EKK55_06980 [Rhodocyclaceae bacterium]
MKRTDWASQPAVHRTAVLRVLDAQLEAPDAKPAFKKAVEAALKVLAVRVRAPQKPTSEAWKLLQAKLRLPETHKEAVAEIAQAVVKAGTVEKAADEFGVHPRTLYRYQRNMPDLKKKLGTARRANERARRPKKRGRRAR